MTTSEPVGQYYELNTLEGAARIFRRTVAKGVTLDESGLSWILTNGQERRRTYREIQVVHLDIHDRIELGICRISFVSGPPLRVFSTAKNKRYGQFIADLHGQLHSEGIDTIRFHGGAAPWAHVIGRVLIVVAVLCALLGIGMALWRGEWEPLKASVIGPAIMLFAAWAIWRRRPVTYTPDQVPPQFFPKGFFSL